MTTRRTSVLVAASIVLSIASSSSGQQYQVTLLDPMGFSISTATDIRGDVEVGWGASTVDKLDSRALLWRGMANTVVDLHPDDYLASQATSVFGTSQAGFGYVSDPLLPPESGRLSRALLWEGSAASVVSLHPQGFLESFVHDLAADQQVGYGVTGTFEFHALFWEGSAASMVDLHPAGYVASIAEGTSGSHQVGFGLRPGESGHALLWSGSAESVVDLHPDAWSDSIAFGVSGNTQVGQAAMTEDNALVIHAMKWSGTAESAVDLHPGLPLAISVAHDAAGNFQAGTGTLDSGLERALLWQGTAASAVHLHSFVEAQLGPDYVGSGATAVDAEGNVAGFVTDASARTYAAKWTRTSASADFDNDGDVDGNDFLNWQRGLSMDDATRSHGDANGDGAVDGSDLRIWDDQYGSQSNVRIVPEPCSVALLALAASLLATHSARAGAANSSVQLLFR